MVFTVRGTIMQTPAPTQLDVRRDAVISVDDGIITSIEDGEDAPPSSVVLLPGLVDTHIHAPQWPQLGTGLDLALETWLFEHTFPLEAKLTDPGFAREVWPSLVSTLLAHGTTTAAYYATIDIETTTGSGANPFDALGGGGG